MTTAPVSSRLAGALTDRYRIERELGAGGMATVYLAEDLKHGRKVALKVLKPELAAVLGADRFVVEIRTTAALQHPHILPLFDSGTADGFLYYVMPFIEGETLRDKLNRETQLGVDEAVRIAREVADALDYAHGKGIIHRDIKPENILLANGRPMVADFGIALAVSAAAGGRMTETGLSLGTPHYMSPEQATADKEISARSDVYSLASVLYEALAGQPPHTGGSAQQVIMKIIAEPVPPVTTLRKSVPPNVSAALAKALEKLPADRFESAKSFADALANIGFRSALTLSASTSSPESPQGTDRRAMAVLGAIAAAAVSLAAWAWFRPQPSQPVTHLDLVLGPTPVAFGADVAISPDGSMLAYAGAEPGGALQIYLRHVDRDGEFNALSGALYGQMPSFSPDGRSLVFRDASARVLKKVSIEGGDASVIGPSPDGFHPHWGTPDDIVYSSPSGVYMARASGGPPVHLSGLTGQLPFLLPDGSGVLGQSGDSVAMYDVQAGRVVTLVPNGAHPIYVPAGQLLYVTRDGGVFAVPFDLKRHRVTGTPTRVLNRVAVAPGTRGFTVSASGTLVYHDADPNMQVETNRLVLVSLNGDADTLKLPSGLRSDPRFSPDGRSIAYSQDSNGEQDVFTYDLRTGNTTQISLDGRSRSPVWSPDSRRIVFTSRDSTSAGMSSVLSLRIRPADNSAAEADLPSTAGNETATDWFDSDRIAVTRVTKTSRSDLLTVALSTAGTVESYLTTEIDESGMVISPDGRYAAFMTDERGRVQVWLRDFPSPKGKWLVSAGIGHYPRWSRDGLYVYFWRRGMPLDSLFRSRIDRTTAVVTRPPELVATINAAGIVNWDLSPDGKRFIVAVPGTDDIAFASGVTLANRRQVVTSWFAELRQKRERQ